MARVGLIGTDGFKQFNQKYGEQLPSGEWQVPARWQAGLSNVSVLLKIQDATNSDVNRVPMLEKSLGSSSTVSSLSASATDTRS